jgi:hypothetical protein
MVKRRREEDIAGVLEFAGRAGDDPEFLDWLADHKARNGGKVGVSQGAKGYSCDVHQGGRYGAVEGAV